MADARRLLARWWPAATAVLLVVLFLFARYWPPRFVYGFRSIPVVPKQGMTYLQVYPTYGLTGASRVVAQIVHFNQRGMEVEAHPPRSGSYPRETGNTVVVDGLPFAEIEMRP